MLGSHSGMSSAGASSATPSISDLDGYNFRDHQFPSNSSYVSAQEDDFGFDPPSKPNPTHNDFTVYSPPNDYSSQWPDFKREDELKPSTELLAKLDAYEMDKYDLSTMPSTTTALLRHGQVTPPRSNSTASTASKQEKISPKSTPLEPRKRGKRTKDSDPSSSTSVKTTTAGRKRKSTKKISTIEEEDDDGLPEDSKRKQSLEKNRVAAAKCRVNKKEKTERLQRDSHDKAVENAYLKEQIMRMKDEVQQMNAILVAHANCEGCKSPEDIQAHLTALGNDFYNQQQFALAGQSFGDFNQMNFSGLPALSDSFFSGSADHMLHPPLPEFNRSAEFEVHTPMQTD